MQRQSFALFCLGLALAFLVAIPDQASAERRIALVIGNSAYQSAAVPSALGDAELIAESLEALGFEITLRTNLKQFDLARALLTFGTTLAQAGEGATGLVYFAGHAIQADGNSYLVPVDASLRDISAAGSRSISLDIVQNSLGRARNGYGLIVIDGCHSLGSGTAEHCLTEVSGGTGTLAALATTQGQIAETDEQERGLFAMAFAEAISDVNRHIMQVLQETRTNVMAQTDGRQQPWIGSSLGGDLYVGDAIRFVEDPNQVATLQQTPSSNNEANLDAGAESEEDELLPNSPLRTNDNLPTEDRALRAALREQERQIFLETVDFTHDGRFTAEGNRDDVRLSITVRGGRISVTMRQHLSGGFGRPHRSECERATYDPETREFYSFCPGGGGRRTHVTGDHRSLSAAVENNGAFDLTVEYHMSASDNILIDERVDARIAQIRNPNSRSEEQPVQQAALETGAEASPAAQDQAPQAPEPQVPAPQGLETASQPAAQSYENRPTDVGDLRASLLERETERYVAEADFSTIGRFVASAEDISMRFEIDVTQDGIDIRMQQTLQNAYFSHGRQNCRDTTYNPESQRLYSLCPRQMGLTERTELRGSGLNLTAKIQGFGEHRMTAEYELTDAARREIENRVDVLVEAALAQNAEGDAQTTLQAALPSESSDSGEAGTVSTIDNASPQGHDTLPSDPNALRSFLLQQETQTFLDTVDFTHDGQFTAEGNRDEVSLSITVQNGQISAEMHHNLNNGFQRPGSTECRRTRYNATTREFYSFCHESTYTSAWVTGDHRTLTVKVELYGEFELDVEYHMTARDRTMIDERVDARVAEVLTARAAQ